MQEVEIKSFIDRLNTGDHKETIFLRRISALVDVARVWEAEPELDDNRMIEIPSYRFFFIRNEIGKYIGAVLDMHRDLHWYILEEERKKGHLTNALRTAIIPYLFYNDHLERIEQRVTISSRIGDENYWNSRKVAEKLGFSPVNEDATEFLLKKDEFDWMYENLDEKNERITEERFLKLKNRLVLSYRQLVRISDELLMSYDDDKGLREIAVKVSYFKLRLEDIEWENREKNE